MQVIDIQVHDVSRSFGSLFIKARRLGLVGEPEGVPFAYRSAVKGEAGFHAVSGALGCARHLGAGIALRQKGGCSLELVDDPVRDLPPVGTLK